MTLSGVDLSSHNSADEFAAALKERDFAICKATEGVSYLNPTLAKFLTDWRAAGKLLGTYHFARPSNDPTAEADWYLANAGARPGEVLVLDFEPYNQVTVEANWGAWIVAFLQRVDTLTDAACWIYLNTDMATRIRRVATAAEWAYITARPLWKASYTSTVGSALGWPAVTCWQWTDTPLDQDLFYGDAAQWRALGVPQEGTVADATLSQETIAAIGKAAADAVYARRFPKQTIPGDTTSLGDLIVWHEPVAVGQANRVIAAIKALPAEPTADDIAKAVVALMPPDTDPADFLDALRARLES